MTDDAILAELCGCPECKHRRNPSLATVIFMGNELLEIEDAHPGYLLDLAHVPAEAA